MPQTRTPAEIRASIEQNRQELGQSLDRLRGEVVRITDWRSQLRQHQSQAIVAAGVAGFVLGGGLAAINALVLGGRSRRSSSSSSSSRGRSGRRLRRG